MSRVGKKPILVPKEVEVKKEENRITVKGPKGTLSWPLPKGIEFKFEPAPPEAGQGQILLSRESDAKEQRSLHGLSRAVLFNMIEGVVKGFEKVLEISGVGYRASLSQKNLVLQVGYSRPVEIQPPAGIEFLVTAPEKIVIRGIDKQEVGKIAAQIKAVRPVEPYKGKGIKFLGETVKRKAGKVAKAVA